VLQPRDPRLSGWRDGGAPWRCAAAAFRAAATFAENRLLDGGVVGGLACAAALTVAAWACFLLRLQGVELHLEPAGLRAVGGGPLRRWAWRALMAAVAGCAALAGVLAAALGAVLVPPLAALRAAGAELARRSPTRPGRGSC